MQVAVIRRALAATFSQRRRRRSNRTAGNVASEQAAFAQAVAAGAGTTVASPTLGVRKANIKHVQTKMQEYSSTRAGKWLTGMQWPQAEDHHHHQSPSTGTIDTLTCEPRTSQAAARDLEPQILDDAASTPIDNPPNEPDPNFAANPANQHEDKDKAPCPLELIDARRAKEQIHQEPCMKKGEEQFFHSHKMRSHKKLRSRKVHKLLLAPETLLPFTGATGLPMVEASPSTAATKPQPASVAGAPASASSDETLVLTLTLALNGAEAIL